MYIPIYDMRQPDAGVLACLEVAVSAAATEALVANIISEAADLLSQLQVRICSCTVYVLFDGLYPLWVHAVPHSRQQSRTCIPETPARCHVPALY